MRLSAALFGFGDFSFFGGALLAAAALLGQSRHRLLPPRLLLRPLLLFAQETPLFPLHLGARQRVHLADHLAQRGELEAQCLGHRLDIVRQPGPGRFRGAKRRLLDIERLGAVPLRLHPERRKRLRAGGKRASQR